MHELSIVDALIEQVGREVHRSGHRGKVLGIEVNIGRLSGVNCDSVRFAFDLLAPGTMVEGSKIVINEIKATCHCHTCNARMEIDDLVFNAQNAAAMPLPSKAAAILFCKASTWPMSKRWIVRNDRSG